MRPWIWSSRLTNNGATGGVPPRLDPLEARHVYAIRSAFPRGTSVANGIPNESNARVLTLFGGRVGSSCRGPHGHSPLAVTP